MVELVPDEISLCEEYGFDEWKLDLVGLAEAGGVG